MEKRRKRKKETDSTGDRWQLLFDWPSQEGQCSILSDVNNRLTITRLIRKGRSRRISEDRDAHDKKVTVTFEPKEWDLSLTLPLLLLKAMDSLFPIQSIK